MLKYKKKPRSQGDVELNMAAMLDMAFQLLAFFILTFRPSAVESQVSLVNVAAMDLGIQLQDLFKLIQERKDQRPEGSYTSYLFNSGIDKILKKVGEESAETIIAAKNAGDDEGRKHLSSEISDLLYHLLVLMVERDVSLYDIAAELSARAGKAANPKN